MLGRLASAPLTGPSIANGPNCPSRPRGCRSRDFSRAELAAPRGGVRLQKIWYTSRFVRVILAQGPCQSSLYRSNFTGYSPKGIRGFMKRGSRRRGASGPRAGVCQSASRWVLLPPLLCRRWRLSPLKLLRGAWVMECNGAHHVLHSMWMESPHATK